MSWGCFVRHATWSTAAATSAPTGFPDSDDRR